MCLMLPVGAVAQPAPRPESVGSFNRGSLVNGAPLPLEGVDHYALYPPACYRTPGARAHYPDLARADNVYAHPAVVDAVLDVAAKVRARVPDAPRLPVGELSNAAGGKIPFHLSHQSGLDVDVAYLQRSPSGAPDPVRRCTHGPSFEVRDPVTGTWSVDPALPLDWNWALASELAARRDVRVILVGTLVREALATWARDHGVPAAERRRTLARLHPVFCRPPRGVTMPTYRGNYCPHDDHFHVRFRCPPKSRRCT